MESVNGSLTNSFVTFVIYKGTYVFHGKSKKRGGKSICCLGDVYTFTTFSFIQEKGLGKTIVVSIQRVEVCLWSPTPRESSFLCGINACLKGLSWFSGWDGLLGKHKIDNKGDLGSSQFTHWGRKMWSRRWKLYSYCGWWSGLFIRNCSLAEMKTSREHK